MSLPMIIENLKQGLQGVSQLLPAHVSYERFIQSAAVAIANNQGLMEADPQSVINSLTQCAKDGLVADNREAALVVFNTKQGNNWIKKAQYMPMVDGVMKRARQSGEITVIASRAIYQNDKFRAWMDGDGEHIEYEPTMFERGQMVGVFAYAKMKTGEIQFEVMNMDDINKVRAASKTSDTGPWKDWFEGMAKKAVMHRLCRRLPNSAELMEMLERGQMMNWQVDSNQAAAPKEKEVVVLPEMPSEKWNELYPQYQALVESGKKTASDIIKAASSKYLLTEDQKEALRQLGE